MRQLYQVWPSALSDGEVSKIIGLGKSLPVTDGTVFSSAADLQAYRSCTVRWLDDDWLASMLRSHVERANGMGFDVTIDGHSEMQLVEYTADTGGRYDWHHDVLWNGQSESDRKLSITVQLSDSGEYCGGDFEFEEVRTNADFRSKGTVIVFPSYLRHRITPLTSGTRLALVGWFFGPRWA
jgi:PKHD-type hydroxylase